jgi:hypothetical protein
LASLTEFVGTPLVSLTEFVQKAAAACSCPHVLTDKNDYQNHLPSIHGSDGSHVSGGFIYQWFPHNFISRWSQIPGSFFSFPKVQGQPKKIKRVCLKGAYPKFAGGSSRFLGYI